MHRETGAKVSQGRSEKMSKSKKNVVDPEHIIATYGADTARLFMLSDSPPDRDLDWTDSGVEGAWRYINRLWRLVENMESTKGSKPDLASLADGAHKVLCLAHKTIVAVSEDLDRFQFNKAVARLRELTNSIDALKPKSSITNWVRRDATEILIQLLGPMLPHLAEEMWAKLGNETLLVDTPWPEADPSLTQEDAVTVAVQVNGKLRGTLELPKDCPDKKAEVAAMSLDTVIAAMGDKEPQKIIIVPNRIVNIVS